MAVPDVVPAIFKATSDPNMRTSMTFGTGLESGWSDTATNPSGATGPYQILLPVHPDITFSQAEDPNASTQFMLPAYKAAVAQVSSNLWASNPEVAAERAVIMAEQPGGPFPSGNTPTGYGSEGVDVVNQRWTQTQGILQGNFSPGTAASTTSFLPGNPLDWIKQFLLGPLAPFVGGNSGSGALGALGKILNFLSNPTDALERIGLILFGAVLILVGLFVLSQGTTAGKAARQVALAPAGGAATRIRGAASGANAARQKQVGLQSKAMQIGERRVAVQEQRQARLSANAQLKAPAVGKHRKAAGKHE